MKSLAAVLPFIEQGADTNKSNDKPGYDPQRYLGNGEVMGSGGSDVSLSSVVCPERILIGAEATNHRLLLPRSLPDGLAGISNLW